MKHKDIKIVSRQVVKSKAWIKKRNTKANGCPDVADSLFNLALVYEKKEEWEKVVDCYQQVYNIESKIFGQDHTQVKETLEALNEAKQHLE